MVQITVTYFNIRGLAEQIRWLLSYAEAEFKDKRVTPEEWAVLKPETLTGKLPSLKYGDFTLHDSNAICRFLAKKYNLAGSNDEETATADMIAQFTADFVASFSKYRYEKDDERKATFLKEFKEVALPAYYAFLVKILEKNGSNGHLVGNSITYIDIKVASIMELLEKMSPEMLQTAPKPVKDLKEKIVSLPSIKAWIEKRPDTEM